MLEWALVIILSYLVLKIVQTIVFLRPYHEQKYEYCLLNRYISLTSPSLSVPTILMKTLNDQYNKNYDKVLTFLWANIFSKIFL